MPNPIWWSEALVGGLLAVSGRQLDLLHAGEDAASSLGMNVRRFRTWQLVAVSLLAGVAVATAGGIGFHRIADPAPH